MLITPVGTLRSGLLTLHPVGYLPSILTLHILFLTEEAKANDTFVEKLTTQIIKNVQVSVQRIHLRYEDKTTRGGQGAFSVGATMNQLSMQTTDENGTPCLSSTAQFIYKVDYHSSN